MLKLISYSNNEIIAKIKLAFKLKKINLKIPIRTFFAL